MAVELAKGIKTQEDLSKLTGFMNKLVIETVLNEEMAQTLENISPFFVYSKDIRKAIYTTNAIESLNSVIRHAIKKRKVFPTDDSVKKVIYLAIQQASKK